MVGRYLCGQGWTELTLEVRETRNGVIDAVFDFAFRPGEITGRFTMRGRQSSSGEVDLRPVAWQRQPAGWIMVGMRGRVGADGVFRGRITSPQCGAFEVIPS